MGRAEAEEEERNRKREGKQTKQYISKNILSYDSFGASYYVYIYYI